jgi:cation transport ATPase
MPLVLAAEAGSPHPIADGFRRAWPGVFVPPATRSEHVLGGGIRATVNGHELAVGSPGFVRSHFADPSANPAAFSASHDATLTPVWVAVDGALVAAAGFGDPIRSALRPQ